MADSPEIFAYLLQRSGLDDARVPVSEGGWERLLMEAEDQGLLWHLGNSQALSSEMRAKLKDRSLVVMARNLALAGELRSCLRTFESAGIECAPMRGVPLMECVYGEIVARPMGDIDILVRRSDVALLRRALSDLGYREMDRRPGFSEEFSYTLKFLVDRQFTIVLEPHLSIVYPPALARLDMEAVWERCVPVTIVGQRTRGLCPSDSLLHLAMHIAHRDNPPLVWLWELDRFIRAEIDRREWDHLANLAVEIGVERIVGQVLARLRLAFATTVPSAVAHRLALQDARKDKALSQTVAEDSEVADREGLAQLLALEGWDRKSRYLAALLMPTPDFMMQQYGLRHRFQLPWAYLIRATGFAWQGMKGISRSISSGLGRDVPRS